MLVKSVIAIVCVGLLAASCATESWSPTGPTDATRASVPHSQPQISAGDLTSPAASATASAVTWEVFANPTLHGTTASALRLAWVPAGSAVANAPGNLNAQVSGSTVTLFWTAPAGLSPASYLVEAGSHASLSDLAAFDTASGATTLMVAGVPPGTYYVRVRARHDGVTGGPSNEIVVTVGVSGPTPAGFTLELPIRLSDSANSAYGLLPFGVHIGDHGIDGHPGWDFEYRPGADVYAAADGIVQSVLPSGNGIGIGIQLEHRVGSRTYRTIYGVGTLAPGISRGASVVAGQRLGPTDIFTRMIGRTTVTYSMTHFQVDDFTSQSGLTNRHAVPPERFLSAAARQAADVIWRSARYSQQLVEPFLANPRDEVFPMTRRWERTGGGLAWRVDITASSASSMSYRYAFHDSRGTVSETGAIDLDAIARPWSTIDFRPDGGAARRGLYAVVNGELTLLYGAPGDARPSNLIGGSTYRTQ